MIRVGDRVRPRPEWRDDPNKIPTGRVVRTEPWGHGLAIYVEDETRAFADYVFELVKGRTRTSGDFPIWGRNWT
jgi:hypothetical protein